MPRKPALSYDRGTLILHPPPKGKAWIEFAVWDDRIEKFRVPANQYRELMLALRSEGIEIDDRAKGFNQIDLVPAVEMEPYPHQQEALDAWQTSGRLGVVVLPTAAGKTYLAQLAMQATQRSTLIMVPTLDLMHQWYANLCAAFPDTEIGLLGGGSRDRTPILVATYDSAAIHAETLGNQYALLVFDECHHLPSDFNRVIAEYAIAPYRLGLTATPERTDGKHEDLKTLIGQEVYRRTPEELSGSALAKHEAIQIRVTLSQQERERYDQLIQIRNAFLKQSNLYLSSAQGWQRFVQASARSKAGRRAMLAHREAKAIAFGTEGKLRVLADLLARHYPERTLIFTDDNATVYRISQDLLIPAITHQTPVKERHEILTKFKQGEYRSLVASRVLNEGVDVPDASIAIVLSGTGSAREYIQRMGRILRKSKDPGKLAILYEVVAEDTNEEGVSRRRNPNQKKKPRSASRQLELVSYTTPPNVVPRAAEGESSYDDW
ncbi:type III restriction enzyme res subunit [Leptolyngbya boryana NIES-2135]|jgi:superfamily II DNA or RNA helicase|uniref:DNA 3'-5' helicase n=1 Tax=Leptolyngbya boryana NIES-2135 TaxID=1973484 RepID=A0A1Z4JKD0_LEPBY|nr:MULTISPECIES: DEAD/DEAH box helicase family protein [Leptolyngbya]BAY57171.1 type III restriction enzyme res subunit [Leptolyngbya boryana NIES-2135]MBD2367078.1 DEAD/DEAH box helicase [Leptolyngbya sp. FACHB-161]MBD2373569.1 DEAD/DEAH box helicase [Leptolyngbya sp. FACHB-238]MBD2397977.1 DEAD/DEAH box helicase [Leptolyngbya sp. FACHB-239]MBD2404479.1 DEAD/DEAH box helicase [Leptolyngbya sp. FACHB-402]